MISHNKTIDGLNWNKNRARKVRRECYEWRIQ